MELLAFLLGKKKADTRKTIADYQREALVREGGKQFQKLVEKGLFTGSGSTFIRVK